MKKYLILQDHDALVKGDEFVENENGMFTNTKTTKIGNANYTCTVTLNPAFLASLTTQGIAELVCPKIKQVDTATKEQINQLGERIKRTTNFLLDMRNAYEGDHMDVVESYTDGDTSVNEYKQATTVYANMIKLIDATLKKLA